MKLKILDANEEIYEMLEKAGAITRLIPGRHVLKVDAGESAHRSIYESDDFGPHKLITVTINKTNVDYLIYHSEDEDFWIIDEEKKEKLVIVFSLLNQEAFIEKQLQGTLNKNDLLAVRIPKNNPRFSFFIMHKGYPHMECVEKVTDLPPSFFVTECRDMDENEIKVNIIMEA